MSSSNAPLQIDDVAIDEYCLGSRWSELDRAQLAKLIALVAMGQATKAAEVIKALEPAEPDFAINELCDEAIVVLTVQEPPSVPRTGYPRFQRDGFVFEVISWIAARQQFGSDVVLKLPHTSSTTQGLDGLMLEIDRSAGSIRAATIFEDKCTDDPRNTFINKVLPALMERHSNRRSAELVSTASALLAIAGLSPRDSSKESARILDISIRRYRSSFAVTQQFDSEERRRFLFGRYNEVSGIKQEQRIGACLVVSGKMREWFDSISEEAVAYIQTLKE